jgi:hypothetical protein
VRLTIDIHESWYQHPRALTEFLTRARHLERPAAELATATPAPMAPPPSPAPSADGADDDGLAELVSGMDQPETAPPPKPPARPATRRTEELKRSRRPAPLRVADTPPATPAPSPVPISTNGAPSSGRALYAWAKDNNLVRRLLSVGTNLGFASRVIDWSPSEVSRAWEELTAAPTSTNGRAR